MVQARISFPEALASIAWNVSGALPGVDWGQGVRIGRHGGRFGRRVVVGIPIEFREVRAWGKRVKASSSASETRGKEAAVVQMGFPLDRLPAYFPDPLRQECFQVRHD